MGSTERGLEVIGPSDHVANLCGGCAACKKLRRWHSAWVTWVNPSVPRHSDTHVFVTTWSMSGHHKVFQCVWLSDIPMHACDRLMISGQAWYMEMKFQVTSTGIHAWSFSCFEKLLRMCMCNMRSCFFSHWRACTSEDFSD